MIPLARPSVGPREEELLVETLRSGRLALLLRPHCAEDDVGDRCEEERHPEAGEHERPDELAIGDGRREDGCHPGEPGGL